jgi:hypothetical protein
MLLQLLAEGFLDEVFATFSDITVYFVMALLGSTLFAIRIIMMLFFGIDDVDFDVDGNVDGGFDLHDTGFSIFSLMSIMSFMMGAGWMGLVCRQEMAMGHFVSAAAASGFGFALMLLASYGMYSLKKLQHSGGYDISTTMGQIGKCYLRIPAKGEGAGKVQINMDGRNSTLPAVSTSEEIESFASVKVVEVRGDNVLVVEKL